MGAADRIEAFLIAAVFSVLAIRFSLSVSGYPQIGGESLHIAHMLWGGLFMLAAIILLLSFIGKGAQWTAAILGGIGFGTFIDEIGKFVTNDNDYFYQPAVSLMHIIFVLTYLVVQRILRGRAFTEHEYLVNALQGLEELAVSDLDSKEKERALHFLGQADPNNPLVQPIGALLRSAELVPVNDPPFSIRIKNRLRGAYQRVIRFPGFAQTLMTFFIIQLAIKLYQGAAVLLLYGWGFETLADSRIVEDLLGRLSELPVASSAELASSLLSALFVLIGVVQTKRSRLAAYNWFQRSILVSILLTQVFMFYREQLSAMVGLVLNILILVALEFMIHEERAVADRRG